MQGLISLGNLPAADLAALIFIVIAWALTGWLVEHPPKSRPSVTILMQEYRRDWMRAFVTRSPRIFDATLIDSHRQSSAFFASASMIAIGGGAALIGNSAAMQELAADLPLDAGQVGITVRILLPLAFMANALLKFIWSHRLFGYCSILMAAVPNAPDDPQAFPRAAQAAEINIRAAYNFNRGLRATYFALASLAWLLGPWALMAATLVVSWLIWSREFASHSRGVLLDPPPEA